MKILLPTHQIGAAGIGTVIEGLCRALPASLGPDDELHLLGLCPNGVGGPNVRCVTGPGILRTRVGRFAYEQSAVARAARKVDLVHLGNPRPLILSSAPFVLTVHDVFFIEHSEWYPRSFVAFKRAMLAAAMAKGPRVIVCDSFYTRDRFLFCHPEAARLDVRVIHPGVSPPTSVFQAARSADPYFLTLATFEPRKNHLGLLRAFRRARARGLPLTWKVAGIAGYRSAEVLSALCREPGVEVAVRVSASERERLYENALFFAFPSHAEGFGFPPLEALVRGVPTICSTGTAMDETVGDAAIRVPPADVEGWARALERLAGDEEERARLRNAGIARVRAFTWERAAASYVESYREALGCQPRKIRGPAG